MTEWEKLVERAERDPEEAFEEALNSLPPLVADEEREAQRQAQHASHMARLKERQAELQRELAALGGKSDVVDPPRSDVGPVVRDVLTYLPSFRGNDYAEAIVAGNEVVRYDLRETYEGVLAFKEALERLGEQHFHLDLDHQPGLEMYHVERVYLVPNEGIFCEGCWSPLGLQLRAKFKGVSPNVFSSDLTKHPLPQEWVAAKQAEQEARGNPTHPVGSTSLGAVCIECSPTFFYDTPETLEAVKAGKLSCPPPVVIDLTTG